MPASDGDAERAAGRAEGSTETLERRLVARSPARSTVRYQKYDLGRLEKGATVVVTLSTGANVRLMTLTDLNNYRNGRRHRYYGGLAKTTPFRIVVPSTGH
jgi:hypothetical protein